MTVLFISSRPMPRCENITAVYEAYQGDKIFNRMYNRTNDILSGKKDVDYDLVVTDELVKESKAPVIMIYHGAACGKTYLLQRPDNWDTPGIKAGSKLLEYVVTSSDSAAAQTMTAKQCGVKPDKILPFGMPRLDKYVNRLRPYKRMGYTYLYAPTFRTLDDEKFGDIDLELMDLLLADGEKLLIKPHMIFKREMPENHYKHIEFLSKDEPSEPYIFESDVLITDYSSIMFDAHAMGIPVVLFEKDADSYLKDPGMCMSYPNGYASRHTQYETELVSLCRSAAILGPKEEDLKCKELTVNMCDGHATERICDLIDKMLEDYCV